MGIYNDGNSSGDKCRSMRLGCKMSKNGVLGGRNEGVYKGGIMR